MTAVLIDTNVLVYPYDRSEPAKAARARQVLDDLARRRRGRVSTQVLGEFFRAVTTRLRPPIPPEDALRSLERHMATWPVLVVTPEIVREAARGVRDHGMNFWDAQIWATARFYRIRTVLSEDFEDDRILEGVRFVNPFVREDDEWP
jgi:predicted nucleic acid-binding protein